MSQLPREDDVKPTLSYFYGLTGDGHALSSTLDLHTPLLLLGDTGVGKTSLLVSILRQLYDQNNNRQIQCFFLDDFQQVAYLFEQQSQTGGASFSHREVEKMLDTFLGWMQAPVHGYDRPYSLLVIDEFERLFRDDEHVIEPFERILSLCRSAEIREHFGIIATTWHEGEEMQSLFRTTIRFAPYTFPESERTRPEARRFEVSGPQQQYTESAYVPVIQYPFPGGQELFWLPIDREGFRENWKEPLSG